MTKAPSKRVRPAMWCGRALSISPIYYTLCTSEAQFHHELRMLKLARNDWPEFVKKNAGATCHWIEESGSRGVSAIVCMDAARTAAAGHTGIQIAALLVHEAMHIWRWIREEIGEKEPASEQEAYAVQHIAQNLMECWAREVPP